MQFISRRISQATMSLTFSTLNTILETRASILETIEARGLRDCQLTLEQYCREGHEHDPKWKRVHLITVSHAISFIDAIKRNQQLNHAYNVFLLFVSGVPAVVDFAAMRDAVKRLGGDPSRINPLCPVDLVIDHSVQVDVSRRYTSLYFRF